MGSRTYGNVGQSQWGLVMINPIISRCTPACCVFAGWELTRGVRVVPPAFEDCAKLPQKVEVAAYDEDSGALDADDHIGTGFIRLVSQNGYLLSRRGGSLPASASGFDTHRHSISSCVGQGRHPHMDTWELDEWIELMSVDSKICGEVRVVSRWAPRIKMPEQPMRGTMRAVVFEVCLAHARPPRSTDSAPNAQLTPPQYARALRSGDGPQGGGHLRPQRRLRARAGGGRGAADAHAGRLRRARSLGRGGGGRRRGCGGGGECFPRVD
jgi:hypothetical protein